MLSQPNKQGGQGEDWDEDFKTFLKQQFRTILKVERGIKSIGFSILNLAFKHFSSWNSVSGTNLGGCAAEPDDSGLPKRLSTCYFSWKRS